MAACSTLFPLSECGQGLLGFLDLRRKPRTTWCKNSSSSTSGCCSRRDGGKPFGRGSEKASIQGISCFEPREEWMTVEAVSRCSVAVRRDRRRGNKQRRREQTVDTAVCPAPWIGKSVADSRIGHGSAGVREATSGLRQVGGVDSRGLSNSQSQRQPVTYHHHYHHHHQSPFSSGVMANLIFVLLLLTSFLLHRCTGVVVHGSYECRSTRASGTDATFRGGTRSVRTAGPLVHSKGDFTNARYNTFQSPRASAWPNHYFPDMECWYNFTAPHGHHVYVEFPLIRIEGDSRMCHWDRDLLTIPTQHLGDRLICGSPTDYGATITGLQSVSIHFKTNSAVEAAGFSGYFFAYPAQQAASMGRRRRRKRETSSQLMQRLRRWISNPYVREMLRQELLRHQEDDVDNNEDSISELEQETIESLRAITLNGRDSVRQHGCHDCRLARLFAPCECAGIECTDGKTSR